MKGHYVSKHSDGLYYIGDYVYTKEQLEKLYFAIGFALDDDDIGTGPPDEYNRAMEGSNL